MILTIWTALKTVGKFVGAAKYYIYAGTLIAGLITLYNYIDNHGEMRAELVACETTVEDLQFDTAALRTQVMVLNKRIANINAARLAELAASKVKMELATRMAWELMVENEKLLEELKVTRFNTLEAIRDDEDFADWANEPVPVVGWSLLRQASEGTTSN